MEKLTLRAYLKKCEREYWERLALFCPDRHKARKIAGVSLATLYRRGNKQFPDFKSGRRFGKMQPPVSWLYEDGTLKELPIVLREFQADRKLLTFKLLSAFGFHATRYEWRKIQRKRSVREYERIYEQCHKVYRIYMRRCHPDLVRGSLIDAGRVTELWSNLKSRIRAEMEALGAEL